MGSVQEPKKGDDEKEPRKKAVKSAATKGKSLTPSSTPNSSRTNSPAGGSRSVRSPVKQVSPAKEVKEPKDESADDSEDLEEKVPEPPVQRTNSPVTRKTSHTLKRQNSSSG